MLPSYATSISTDPPRALSRPPRLAKRAGTSSPLSLLYLRIFCSIYTHIDSRYLLLSLELASLRLLQPCHRKACGGSLAASDKTRGKKVHSYNNT